MLPAQDLIERIATAPEGALLGPQVILTRQSHSGCDATSTCYADEGWVAVFGEKDLRITATHIEGWADTREAQAHLPLLVRRLVQATSATTALVMPAGDSINAPGWDGITDACDGNPWVPAGPARWEMGCDSRPNEKASNDFAKRVFESTVDEMLAATYVFVTPRRWRQRDVWKKLADGTAPWRSVRVIDADDLEAWLERAPAVALWFAELLGLSGSGIESTDSFWQRWRWQSRCRLTTEAILVERDAAAQRFDELISAQASVIAVEADSREEAVAFACVRLAALSMAGNAACITSADGWRFVDCNAALHVVIACSSDVASACAPREGLSLVVPIRRGDRTEGPLGARFGTVHPESHVVSLARPSLYAFEQQLVRLGEEESYAARLSRSVGRSWSVYRRVCAKNPAISQPPWLSQSFLRTLSTLSLVGSWNGAKKGDRSCVQAVDGRPYEELEQELLSLRRLDDSPVVQIGTVWRARSPLELLHLCAPGLTSGALDRFFSVANAVLAKPDPSLELDEDKRWMANVYGKTREESGIVIDAIADALVKLSVYAERGSAESSEGILGRVNALVRQLLHDASGEQWLSASGVLRELAEAAPEEFLSAVDCSLRSPHRAVTRLISESSGPSGFGRCWHANLLWALELLAWAPERLHRVAEILAKLSVVPVPGNWGNTPAGSLRSLFRAWWPQTMASSQRRLAVLDKLIRDHNGSAWSLLIAMLPQGPQWASANAAPVWREDDAGKADLRGCIDLWYFSEVGQRVIFQATGRPERIATLVASLDSFDGRYRESVVRLVEGAVEFDDDGRIAVRDSLGKYLSWHNSRNRDDGRKSRSVAEELRPMFDRLAPTDPVKASLWLFASAAVNLPDGRELDYERHHEVVAQKRCHAFGSVYASQGWPGITRLAAEAADPWLVGWEVGRSALVPDEIVEWVIGRRETVGWGPVDSVLRGVLAGMSDEKRTGVLRRALHQLEVKGLATAIPELLINAPFAPETWTVLEALCSAAQDGYWSAVIPGFCRLDTADASTVVSQLTRRGRARSAFQLVMYAFESIDAIELKGILDAIRSGAEPDGPLPDGWHIGQAISAIETSGKVSRRDLALLEFAFFRALEHTEHGVRNLYAELLSDPALFMECICMVYMPRSGEPEPVSDSMKVAADMAWHILHSGRGIPGLKPDGCVDGEALNRWVKEVRRLAAESDRVAVVDVTIGGWLSDCPPDGDGTWPPSAVAEVLDDDLHEDMRRGFCTGVFNNRGVTTRAMGEGGAQERTLAAVFRQRSEAIALRFPRLSEALASIAKGYEQDARREDTEAKLRSEGL